MKCKKCGCKITQDIQGWFHSAKAVNWNNKRPCEKAEPKIHQSKIKCK